MEKRQIQEMLQVGVQQHQAGRLDEAESMYREILRFSDNNSDALNLLGVLQRQRRRLDEAVELLRKAAGLRPTVADYQYNLGNALYEQAELEQARTAYVEATRLAPEMAEAHNNLGRVLKDQGRVQMAMECFRRALRLRPGFSLARSNLLFTMHYLSFDPKEVFQEHLAWDQANAFALSEKDGLHENGRSPARRLRIGYVSRDFRDHPVGRGLLPLLEMHDRGSFEIVCYSDVTSPDGVTERIGRCAGEWHSVTGMADSRLAEMIRQQRIDILVDLGLHSPHNRLGVFARRPAPVQITYGGYPATTGLRAMDYRLTDAYLDPPGASEAYNSEKLLRLKGSFWCYPTDSEEPGLNALPAGTNGFVTFGSLNNACKCTPEALDLWSAVMKAVAGSKLMIMVNERSGFSSYFAEEFEKRGVEAGRLVMVARRGREGYMRLYHQIDIGLDPLPYNGHMTSCDSFWMGVPVVSKRGSTSVGRGGVSLLSNLDLKELIAETPEQFVEIARELAGDLARLARMREGMRARMKASPLCDAKSAAADMEGLFRGAWESWCASGAK